MPIDVDWTVLKDYLAADGQNGKEGTALKVNLGWNDHVNGTDAYRWLVLPVDYHYSNGYFDGIAIDGN